jgi:hypothetical protein
MDMTPPSELDRILQNPDHVILSDELSDSLNILTPDAQLLEIDGRAFAAILISAKSQDTVTGNWEIEVSVPGLSFDDVAVARKFLFHYNDLQMIGSGSVEFKLEGVDRFLILSLKRIFNKDE